ncbi:MAG: DJ/PfpI family protein [Hymenobacter sp.]|jgi:transcriptional regulator GlxA family with amidase domain|nr:DJ/PfpI family protein [Hymenobacter sp.]
MKTITLLIMALFALIAGRACSQTNAQAAAVAWYCPPCGGHCDLDAYAAPGTCRHCGMALMTRSAAADSLRAQHAPGTAQPRRLNVAILVFDGMEILDFAGPGEVFSVAPGFTVYTVALSAKPVMSQGFVAITPNYTLANCPMPDIVVVPGGNTGQLLGQEPLIGWVQACAQHAAIMLSVCTGAGVLGKAGLLDGKQATTFHSYLDELQRTTPKATIVRNTRFVDNGQVITTAGISAGIDGALHVVAKLRGEKVALATAQHMEYDKWRPNQGLVVPAARPMSSHAVKQATNSGMTTPRK